MKLLVLGFLSEAPELLIDVFQPQKFIFESHAGKKLDLKFLIKVNSCKFMVEEPAYSHRESFQIMMKI